MSRFNPIPTISLKLCIDSLTIPVSEIVNKSLIRLNSVFLSVFKRKRVIQLLKKKDKHALLRLGQRRRRWSKLNTTLFQYVFAGKSWGCYLADTKPMLHQGCANVADGGSARGPTLDVTI